MMIEDIYKEIILQPILERLDAMRKEREEELAEPLPEFASAKTIAKRVLDCSERTVQRYADEGILDVFDSPEGSRIKLPRYKVAQARTLLQPLDSVKGDQKRFAKDSRKEFNKSDGQGSKTFR
ncbi:MAG: hypothetical protein AAF992_14800 [Bacteroidota bacterium]